MTARAPSPRAIVEDLPARRGPDLLVLTGARGAGKSRWCERLVAEGRAAGLAIAGLLSPAVIEGGTKVAIDLEDLATGDRRRLAVLPPPGSPGTAGLGWLFDQEALAWGNEAMARTGSCDLLVVDELGPLELRRAAGLTSAFGVVDARRYRLAVVVVRPSLLERALSRWPWASVSEP